MVESENSLGTYKTLKISIGTIMKNPEMLKFFPDCHETKKMCKMQLRSSRFK